MCVGYTCVSIFLAAAVSLYAFGTADRVRAHAGERAELTLTVLAETGATEESSTYSVKVHGGDLPAFNSLLYCEYASGLLPGDVVCGTFELLNFEEDISGYPERYHQLSLSRPVKLISQINDLSLVGSEYSPALFFASLNSAVAARFDGALSADCAGLAKCLVLGDKETLSPSLERDFTLLGLSHMLAISGMHLTVLCSLAYVLLSSLHIPRPARNLIMIVSLCAFMALTGFPPSLTRSGCTMIVMLLFPFFKRRGDSATALCFAVAVICASDPFAILDTGLQLSFLATLGIVTLPPLLQKKLCSYGKMPGTVKSILLGLYATAVAITFTLPVTVTCFSSFSFAGFFTTMLFSPLLSALLYLCVGVLVLAGIPVIGDAACAALSVTERGCTALAAFLSDTVPLTLSTEYPFVPAMLALFCLALTAILLIFPKNPVYYLLPLVCFTVACGAGAAIYEKAEADTPYLYISGQKTGDILCVKSRGHAVLIDYGDCTANTLTAAGHLTQTRLHENKIDAYILTDFGDGTAKYVSNLAQSYKVGGVYLPEGAVTPSDLEGLRGTLADEGTQLYLYGKEEALSFHGVTYTFEQSFYLSAPKEAIPHLRIQSGDTVTLYLGASYADAATFYPNSDTVILGNKGPENEKPFSAPECKCYISEEAAKWCYDTDVTVYSPQTKVILNND